MGAVGVPNVFKKGAADHQNRVRTIKRLGNANGIARQRPTGAGMLIGVGSLHVQQLVPNLRAGARQRPAGTGRYAVSGTVSRWRRHGWLGRDRRPRRPYSDQSPGHRRAGQIGGCDLCMNLRCDCGLSFHMDGYFMYYIRCPHCKQVYMLNPNIKLTKLDVKKEDYKMSGYEDEQYADDWA